MQPTLEKKPHAMAERKATNKYYPPDWDPSKVKLAHLTNFQYILIKGSLNKYVGQHPLRDRARKLSEGILIIRYFLKSLNSIYSKLDSSYLLTFGVWDVKGIWLEESVLMLKRNKLGNIIALPFSRFE